MWIVVEGARIFFLFHWIISFKRKIEPSHCSVNLRPQLGNVDKFLLEICRKIIEMIGSDYVLEALNIYHTTDVSFVHFCKILF